MIFKRRSIFGLALFFVSMICSLPAQNLNFSGKSVLKAFEEVSRQGKLNVVTNVPDSTLDSFVVPASTTSEMLIEGLAKKIGCVAALRGETFLVLPKKQYQHQEGNDWIFVQSQERPVERVLSKLTNFPPPEIVIFPFPEANSCVFSGFRDDLREARELFQQKDLPGKLLKIGLSLTAPNSSGELASLVFLTIDDVPTLVEFQKKEEPGNDVLATISVSIKDRKTFELSGIFCSGENPSPATENVSSIFLLDQTASQSFSVRLGKTEIVGNWSVEVMPGTERLIASLSEAKPVKSTGSVPVCNKPPTEPLMQLMFVQKPIQEVLSPIVASAGGNLVCDCECSGTVSLFCFGPNLYYEEILNLIVKAKDYGVRKIGNTWSVAPSRKIIDIFCRGLFITKRLQYFEAKKLGVLIPKMLSHFGIGESTPFSFDTWINALVFGGNRGDLTNLKNFLEFVDSPPIGLALQTAFSRGTHKIQETLVIPTGSNFEREIGDAQATSTLELRPVLFGNKGTIGLHYDCSHVDSDLKTRVRGWTYLPISTGTTILEAGGKGFLRLSISGACGNALLPETDMTSSFPDSFTDDGKTFVATDTPVDTSTPGETDGFDNTFDKAFDSSF